MSRRKRLVQDRSSPRRDPAPPAAGNPKAACSAAHCDPITKIRRSLIPSTAPSNLANGRSRYHGLDDLQEIIPVLGEHGHRVVSIKEPASDVFTQPFFLYHATRGCHFDNYPSDEWAGKSESRTVYGDCMVQMDYVLGQLVISCNKLANSKTR